MFETTTLQKAGEIWSYMSSFKRLEKSDAIVVCCSYDLRVCDHACQLIFDGYSDRLVISGKSGNWTKHIYNESEAEIFYRRAILNGVKKDVVIVEPEATNFGENVTFSKALIPDAKTVTFISKPNSLLRVKLTAQAQWPEVTSYVSCPDINFPHEVSNIIGVFGVINEMVGDIERIKIYPSVGYQAKHRLPDSIDQAWEFLKAAGFTEHIQKR